MKGFIHIVEIIIIALVVLVLLTQFVAIPGLKTDWERTKLTILGRDVLLALDRSGINWFDVNNLDSNLSALLGNNTIYSIEIEGVPPSNISIGCNCSDEEFNFIKNLVNNIPEINNQKFGFFVEQAESFDLKYDLVLTFKPIKNRFEAESFLSSGKGIIEILPDPEIDEIQQEFFGLDSTTESITENNLTWAIGPANISWQIYKYFHTIPNSTGEKWPEPWQFKNFLQKAVKSKNSILKQTDTENTGATFNIPSGRTAWFGASFSDIQAREDLQTFLKALILQTSGNKWTAISGPGQITISYYTFIKKDFFQPIKITLKLKFMY
jgi:hypothetical protein